VTITARPAADEIPQKAVKIWTPSPYQRRLLSRIEFEVGAGGAAGPGKTDALMQGGLRDVKYPDYHAGYFRREYPRLQEVIDRTHRYFKQLGAEWNEQKKRWTFPSGARYSFHHMQNENDKYNYLGDEFTYLAFDQLEEFTETQLTFLIGRMRTAFKRKLRLRTSFNPGGEGHLYVMKRYRIDTCPEGYNPFRDPDTGLSRVFIPGRVWDNPHIVRNDPQYIQRLLSISDPALRRAYLFGDWNVFAGQFFSIYDPRLVLVDPFSIPEWWDIGGGIDYGLGPAPTTIELCAFNEHGMAHFYREITLENASAHQIAEALLAAARTPKEQCMTIEADTQMWTPNPEKGGLSVAQMINDHLADRGSQITLVQANKDRINGWARLFEYMDPRRPLPTGGVGPWMKIFKHRTGSRYGCPRLIETIPVQQHDEKKPGDMKKNPTDHWVETARYALAKREPLALIPADLLPKPTHLERIHSRTRTVLKNVLRRQRRELVDDDDGTEIMDVDVGADFDDEVEIADVWD
jgi:phage terminase large subunit